MSKLAALILTVVILWIQYHIWFGESSPDNLEILRVKISEQKKQNLQIAVQNSALKQEINLVRNEPEILEEKARENLGLIKQGEIFYRIIPNQSEE